MKNMIVGIFGCFLLIYTVILSLGIYSITTRRNEVDNCLASCLESAMRRYYEVNMYTPGGAGQDNNVDSSTVEEMLVDDIEERLNSDSDVETTVYVCDMQKGIISAKVEEKFELPGGIEKIISCTKTIIADRSVYE
ncbi:MAG: hypothetical protein II243_02095 [Lachnospiraceae bacterium]|nr:hypothetical protein [Lachnospiraceae bacterium]MEE1101995.1 hypothetical protein [Agathobacter sp.]